MSVEPMKLEDVLRLLNGPSDRYQSAHAAVSELITDYEGFRAARIAYASEFEPDADGLPDVGNIHQNIRKLKAKCDSLQRALLIMRFTFSPRPGPDTERWREEHEACLEADAVLVMLLNEKLKDEGCAG